MPFLPDLFKKISASIFSLILVCFILPFRTISSGNSFIQTYNGIQTATGNMIASLSLISAIVGLAIVLLLKNQEQKYLISAISSGIGICSLLWIESRTHGAEINNMAVTYHLGFWLALLFYLLATGVNGYQYVKERKW